MKIIHIFNAKQTYTIYFRNKCLFLALLHKSLLCGFFGSFLSFFGFQQIVDNIDIGISNRVLRQPFTENLCFRYCNWAHNILLTCYRSSYQLHHNHMVTVPMRFWQQRAEIILCSGPLSDECPLVRPKIQ